MKTCTQCKFPKDLEDFTKTKNTKDGRIGICKSCMNDRNKAFYAKNKEVCKERSKKTTEQARQRFQDFKKTLKCLDCGEPRWWVLQFHHRDPSKKELTIGKFIPSKEKLEKELSKCDVLCANCHLDRHHQERLKTKSL